MYERAESVHWSGVDSSSLNPYLLFLLIIINFDF